MKNYLQSSSSIEREFRFSERVLSPNGSSVGGNVCTTFHLSFLPVSSTKMLTSFGYLCFYSLFYLCSHEWDVYCRRRASCFVKLSVAKGTKFKCNSIPS